MPFVEYPYSSDLNVDAIVRSVRCIYDIVGQKWLDKKIEQSEKLASEERSKFRYLNPGVRHPLVEWFVEYRRWKREIVATGRMALYPSIVKIWILGQTLELASTLNNFDKLLARLKLIDHFASAAFEAEVAAGYLEADCKVEFVETGTEKTPDLKVTPKKGASFWVECECRDALTERDQHLDKIWQELKVILLNYLVPRKLNYLIVVKTRVDPENSDRLREAIVQAVSLGGVGSVDPATQAIQPTDYPDGDFELVVHKLSEPDVEFETDGIGFAIPSSSEDGGFFCETRINERGKQSFRNPIVISFETTQMSDRVSGVLNSVKHGAHQLPKGEPGIIWVRVPDNSWVHNLPYSFLSVEKLVQKELSGEHNRRVNSVYVATRIFESAEKEGSQGLLYRPIVLRVDHTNPENPLT